MGLLSPVWIRLETFGSSLICMLAASARMIANDVNIWPYESVIVRFHSACVEKRLKSPGMPRKTQFWRGSAEAKTQSGLSSPEVVCLARVV
jgi:hypothetical protein